MATKFALSRLVSLLALAGAVMPVAPAFAQSDPTTTVRDEDEDQNIVVTGAVRQGGAQDIRHFRSISTEGEFMPPSDSLTLEGLLGEHDLTLPSAAGCDRMFCLVAHSMEANLPLRPRDKYFVGLDFASNIDAEV